jgi:endonuclease YncB( thermonuclease family)
MFSADFLAKWQRKRGFGLARARRIALSLCAMIRLFLLLMVLTACSGPAGGGAGWRAIDGDTIRDAAGRVIRVIGVDSPEMPGHAQCAEEAAAGLAARDFTAAALAGAKRIELRERGLDRYRRQLAIVLIDGKDLAALLIQAGHGRAYHGERRRPWC